MKTKATILFFGYLLAFCTVSTIAHSQTDMDGTWSTVSSTGFTPAFWLSSNVVNNKIYVIGGIDTNGNVVSGVQVFDPSTNKWSKLATKGTFTPRFAMGTTVLDGKIYALGGSIGDLIPKNMSNKLEVFDPSTNTWSTPKTTGKFTPRGFFSACTVNGKIYAIGGYSPATGELNTFEVFDPSTNKWSTPKTKGKLIPWGAGGNSCPVINDKIYLVAGNGASSLSTAAVQVFDPSTNTWSTHTATGTFTPRLHMTASPLNGKIYVTGGTDDNGGVFNALEAFDPSTNTWSTPKTTGAFAPRAWFTSNVVNGKIYAIGGRAKGKKGVEAIEVFTPSQKG